MRVEWTGQVDRAAYLFGCKREVMCVYIVDESRSIQILMTNWLAYRLALISYDSAKAKMLHGEHGAWT